MHRLYLKKLIPKTIIIYALHASLDCLSLCLYIWSVPFPFFSLHFIHFCVWSVFQNMIFGIKCHIRPFCSSFFLYIWKVDPFPIHSFTHSFIYFSLSFIPIQYIMTYKLTTYNFHIQVKKLIHKHILYIS